MPAADGPHLRVAPEPGAEPVLQLPMRNLRRMAALLAEAVHRSDVDGSEVKMGAAMLGEVLTLEADVVLAVARAYPSDGLAEHLLSAAC